MSVLASPMATKRKETVGCTVAPTFPTNCSSDVGETNLFKKKRHSRKRNV